RSAREALAAPGMAGGASMAPRGRTLSAVTTQPTAHDGTTILVTGAGGDLGRAVIRQLLAAGGRVVALDRDPAALRALADAHGDAVLTREADVGEGGDVDTAFAWALA